LLHNKRFTVVLFNHPQLPYSIKFSATDYTGKVSTAFQFSKLSGLILITVQWWFNHLHYLDKNGKGPSLPNVSTKLAAFTAATNVEKIFVSCCYSYNVWRQLQLLY
jgi:hypothetical protein